MKYVMKKKTLESIIKFREHDLFLILDFASINVEFYSLSNCFYFIILCCIEQKI
jgi:negative regulator of genetic competence, sporulation and motility